MNSDFMHRSSARAPFAGAEPDEAGTSASSSSGLMWGTDSGGGTSNNATSSCGGVADILASAIVADERSFRLDNYQEAK